MRNSYLQILSIFQQLRYIPDKSGMKEETIQKYSADLDGSHTTRKYTWLCWSVPEAPWMLLKAASNG